MNISVNCPSYKRPKVETLDYLPYCKVWVAESEYEDYIKANKGFEENIIKVPDKVQGNVSRIRNYILDNELPKNDCVIIIDDDLKAIRRFEAKGLYGYDKVDVTAEELIEMAENYTVMCRELGFKIWGLNCNQDALSYRKTTPFSTLSFIGSPFHAHIDNSPLRYDERLPLKEDYDMTIQHCNKYRGCLRINKCHYDCKQSKQAGGCATYRNYDREMQQLKLLQKKWGHNIVKFDTVENSNTKKKRKNFDYNPIIKIPIKGV